AGEEGIRLLQREAAEMLDMAGAQQQPGQAAWLALPPRHGAEDADHVHGGAARLQQLGQHRGRQRPVLAQEQGPGADAGGAAQVIVLHPRHQAAIRAIGQEILAAAGIALLGRQVQHREAALGRRQAAALEGDGALQAAGELGIGLPREGLQRPVEPALREGEARQPRIDLAAGRALRQAAPTGGDAEAAGMVPPRLQQGGVQRLRLRMAGLGLQRRPHQGQRLLLAALLRPQPCQQRQQEVRARRAHQRAVQHQLRHGRAVQAEQEADQLRRRLRLGR
ncbi:hypothetical protein HMPREF0731_2157, partial [Pseudoroseomonas cervicalis ATCC 49957]